MSIEKELAELKTELETAKQTASSLEREIDQLKVDLKAKEEAYKKLVGGWANWGVIQRLEEKVNDLELELAHSKMPKVVWVKCSQWEKDYIVHKVTKKRIYVGRPGLKSTSMYNKDGTPVSSCGSKIDIDATFGGPCPEKL